MKINYNELIGTKYENLEIIAIAEPRFRKGKNRTRPQVICRCICGSEKPYLLDNLRRKHGTGTQSCGCLNSILISQKMRLQPFKAKYNLLLRTAKRRNRLVSITYEDFLKFTTINKCHYCCAKINWQPFIEHGNKNFCGYNLDRKDHTKGYVIDNLVVCCPRCNWGKQDMFTYSEWYQMTEMFRNENIRRTTASYKTGREGREAGEEGIQI